MQPTKVISSLVDSNFEVIPSTSLPFPPGSKINVPTYTPPSSTADLESNYVTMYQVAGSNILRLDQFMNSYRKFGTKIPGDITDFSTQYAKYLVTQGVITEDQIPATVSSVLNGFTLSFQTATGFTSDAAQIQALSTLYPNIGTFGMGNAQDPDQYAMTNTMWTNFVNQYNYQANGSISSPSTTPAQGFFQQLSAFLAVTATVSNNGNILINNGSGGVISAVSAATPAFEQLFYQYFPTPNPNPDLQQKLTLFARDMLNEYGYFSPSRQYTDWVAYVQDISNTRAAPAVTLPPTSVNILNDIFLLITGMITALQGVAASQADRLALYTSWQQGYTDLLNQVPTFTGSSKDRLRNNVPGSTYPLFGVQDQTLTATRNNEQANFNPGVTQQITAYNNTISTSAKSLQSNVNQSSDAFNNQANTATSLLQNITTILNSIFR